MKQQEKVLLELFVCGLVPTDLDEPKHNQQSVTPKDALKKLYDNVSLRFPPLYEALLLTYSWSNASSSQFQLHDNPPGEDLSGFVAAITSDKILFNGCIQNKLLIFGKSSNSYNPICFYCIGKSPRHYSIVEVDHESILTPGRKVRLAHILAKDFESLCQR